MDPANRAGGRTRGTLVVLFVVVLGTGLSSCDGAPATSEPEGWVEAAASVRRSVHSVWASRSALDGMTAFAPVGTGFVIGVDSLGASVLTNAHVATSADGTPLRRLSVLVMTDTGSVLHGARLLASDRARDLALLGVADTTLVPVRWASERIPMGTPVATIGFGLPEGGIVDTAGAQVVTRFTVTARFTAGYSSTYRTLTPGDPATNVLEVDLFLFPGVSGGPTFTQDGQVVGVNRGVQQLGRASTSYGHAIPLLVVRQFLEAAGFEDLGPVDSVAGPGPDRS